MIGNPGSIPSAWIAPLSPFAWLGFSYSSEFGLDAWMSPPQRSLLLGFGCETQPTHSQWFHVVFEHLVPQLVTLSWELQEMDRWGWVKSPSPTYLVTELSATMSSVLASFCQLGTN